MKAKIIITTVVLCVIAALASITLSRGEQITKLQQDLQTAQSELSIAKQEKEDLKRQYEEVRKIDKGYNDEINAIKRHITDLRNDINNGSIRLRVNVIPTPAATSGNNAGAYELDPLVRPDYYTLRSGIMEQQAQIKKLQEYINTQCYKAR